MVDVFISYARANRDTVCRLAGAIGRLGYVVWWDEELPAHLSYGEVITQKIAEAKATLVIWSAESAASEWVRAEADMARNQRRLIQASIDDCVPPLPFNQIQFAAIGDWSGAEDHPGWRKVRASLEALCGPAVAETAVAPVALAAAPPPPAVAPRVSRPAPRRDLNRIALIAITASVMTLLTVGGLVIVNGPPRAQAAETAAPASAAAPAQAAAAGATPPKAPTVEAAVEPGDTIGEGVDPDPVLEATETGEDS